MGIKAVSFGVAIACVLFFQNCAGRAGSYSTTTFSDGGGDNRVIGETNGYTHIEYQSPSLAVPAAKPSVSIDLISGQFSGSSGQACVLDLARLSLLRDIMSNAQICEPAPLPPGMAVCMAIGVPDITLSSAQGSIQLQPVICNSGVFLCDGLDAKLRAALQDLQNNPPCI